MTRTTRGVLVVAAALIAAAAGAVFVKRAREPKPLRIAGRTVGPEDAPLADVRIILEVSPGDSEDESSVERVETRSDAKGEFAIDFIGHWRRASYRLEAQKPGFEELSIEDPGSLRSPVTLRLAKSP